MSGWLCALVIVFVLVLLAAVLIATLSGSRSHTGQGHGPRRAFRYCPGCGADTDDRDRHCPECDLLLDSRLARDLNRLRIAEREVRALVDRAQLDRDSAGAVLDQLEARARDLQGLTARKPGARPRAMPVAKPVAPAPLDLPEPATPAASPDIEATPASEPLSEPLPAATAPVESEFSPASAALSIDTETLEPARPLAASHPAHEPLELPPPPPPKRRVSSFLEEHNILWGELVGGLLIVGCSIALLVTLWRQLEEIRYFPFALSFGVTLALFGAGQYTLHRWKLAGTSRGMLVISMLLTPLTLLLLSEPVAHGTGDPFDIAIKLGALAAFVGIVRTGGRDLIGTEHLTGPIDRRWLLSLAVVGAAGTQLLPASLAYSWAPLLCFVVACAATLGGLSWYHPGRREEPISDKSGTALVMFVGLAVFSLFAAWGLYLVRPPIDVASRLHALAIPLALAAVPVVEAGVLVLRRVTSAGLRTTGTAVALLGFLGLTTALALAWPNPLSLLAVSAAAGAFLTRVAFRERLVWVQIGAIPLLAFAGVLGFHGAAGRWTIPAEATTANALGSLLNSSNSGAVLVGFSLVLALVTELLARRPSRQVFGYAIGGLVAGAFGLVLLSSHGTAQPAAAAIGHAAAAVALLATNARWKRRSIATGGLWLVLGATLWALWAIVPNQPEKWGLVISLEALVFALGAVAGRKTHGEALAQLRRAGRDVSFVACVAAVALAAFSGTFRSDWHTGTLFALAFTAAALARLTGWAPLTWTASAVALLGFVHLALQPLGGDPQTLSIETAILTHATLATLAAVACRRQARVFGEPLQWSARISSALAVPLLFFAFFAHVGYAFVAAMLAGWLGAVWLAFVLLWRERGAFSAFQAAFTLAGLLVAFGWIEQQTWWAATTLHHFDPRALHAFGLALASMAIVWAVARRALQPLSQARELWCDNPLSFDRLALGATIVGFLTLAVVAILPGVREELTPLEMTRLFEPPSELVHAFDTSAWWVFALLAVAGVLSWRLSRFAQDSGPHAIGLALLLLAAPVLWAGTHTDDVATASALRWGLALAFAVGSAALALRAPVRRGLEAGGFVVQPEPWLRPALLALVAVAAGVVIVLSAQVAELGLNRLTPSGPAERSVFALMGTIPSNLVPLALVVFGLALTAARERSSGYALSGGLVFTATLTAGYALAVVVAGKPLDGPEQTRLFLITASGAALWAIAWLASERRVPGGELLAVQVCIGFGALGLVCFFAAASLNVAPDEPLRERFEPLGQFGWLSLALVACAGFWHTRRAEDEAFWHTRTDSRVTQPLLFGFVALVVGVLVAAVAREIDAPGSWRSAYALAITWAAGGFVLLATLRHSRVTDGVLTSFAALLVFCALRGAWNDPWRPWLQVVLSLSAAIYLGAIALRRQLGAFAVSSALAVNLAAVTIWLAHGPDTLPGFLLTNAAGAGVAVACWTLIRIRRSADESNWLAALDPAPLIAFGLLALGLAPTLTGESVSPRLLAWGAAIAVALGCAVGLWDRAARFALVGLYMTGVLAVLLAVAQIDKSPVWNAPVVSVALAAFVLAVAWAAFGMSRRVTPLLGMPDRGDIWQGFLVAQIVVATVAVLLGVRTGLIAPDLLQRLASPVGVAMLAAAFATMVRVRPEALREPLQTASVALGVLTLCALAWALPAPSDPFAWLHRNAWLFVALTVAAIGGSEGAPLVGTDWARSRKRVAGWAAVLAFAVLCVNLLQQVPAFDPVLRRTPLSRDGSLAAYAMLAATVALFALAIRFALREDRDPFALPAARRTAYVYVAEVLIVLFFTQIRFNVPELFLGNVAKFWTFAVMALAYTGIGLAELFERKKLDVLAVPLRRTGVLLPLVPLVAFWAKPPAFLSELAQTTAPGLGPLLGYLEKLPQHFDMYAWLWFLAGGVYGLLALKRKSFGWALLAALATNAAMWSLLAHHQIPFAVHPQAWVIPLALIVLLSEHINRKRLSAEASNAMRYTGIAMIYVASAADMFIAGVGSSLWLPIVLAVLCVCGVLAGIVLRVRAFVYLGAGFLLLDVFAMIWHAAVNLQQTWVWYASGIVLGVLVLGLFAYLEKRRTHERGAE